MQGNPNINRLFIKWDRLLQQILAMSEHSAVFDASMESIQEIHSYIVSGMHEIFMMSNPSLARRYKAFYEGWKDLRHTLIEGVNIRLARSQAHSCLLTALSMKEYFKEVWERQREALDRSYWAGDSIRMQLYQAMALIKKERTLATRQLFQVLKRCLYMEPQAWRLRYIEIFFETLAQEELPLSIKFLEIFNFEQGEVRDLALLCILMTSQGKHLDLCVPLIARFSNEQHRFSGVQGLFLGCYETQPDMGLRLIKKMVHKTARNESLALLSTSRAKQGDLEGALRYCEMITSHLLKRKQDEILKSYSPDTRPIFYGV